MWLAKQNEVTPGMIWKQIFWKSPKMSRKASVAQLIFIKVTRSKLQPAVIAGISPKFSE